MSTCAVIARPRNSYPEHVPVEPLWGNGWSSWWCVGDGHHCASGSLCDCCELDIAEWMASEDAVTAWENGRF